MFSQCFVSRTVASLVDFFSAGGVVKEGRKAGREGKEGRKKGRKEWRNEDFPEPIFWNYAKKNQNLNPLTHPFLSTLFFQLGANSAK